MSLMTRLNFVWAIIFGCVAILLPRILVPLFRPKSSPTSDYTNDNFRPVSPALSRPSDENPHDHLSNVQSPVSAAYSNPFNPNINDQEQSTSNQQISKSQSSFALPMYTVGILVFLLYTCFKYWTKRDQQENYIRSRYSSSNIKWNNQQKEFKYHSENRRQSLDIDEELYAGLDVDYVEYLKEKRREKIQAEQTMANEQQNMNSAFDEMKNSLSFINSKLGTADAKSRLTYNEIAQLQARLASSEEQMCKILNALDAATTKVNELTKLGQHPSEQSQKIFPIQEDFRSSSQSQSEDAASSDNDERNSNSDDDSSLHEEEQMLKHDQIDEEEDSSMSYEEEEEMPMEADDESESSSDEPYGFMNTNYGCDPSIIDDYELNSVPNVEQANDSRTKVDEWRQRNHSQSLSSSHESLENCSDLANNVKNDSSIEKSKE